jgi:hypothetical protein
MPVTRELSDNQRALIQKWAEPFLLDTLLKPEEV